MKPKITLEQWQALLAVVDAGGYSAAAEQLNKSQSAISYAIQKIETQLDLAIFELSGRKSVLTTSGKTLYFRAQALLNNASMTEKLAHELAKGQQTKLSIAVDTITPLPIIMGALAAFAQEYPFVRVQLLETVLSGGEEALESQQADLAVVSSSTHQHLETPFLQVRFIPVAHPEHPLHSLKREITQSDLQSYRQLVVKDSGSQDRDSGWLQADMRWTFSNMETSIQAAALGLGYAWFPETKISQHLLAGSLQALPLSHNTDRYSHLSIALPQGEFIGPSTQRLAELILEQARANAAQQP